MSSSNGSSKRGRTSSQSNTGGQTTGTNNNKGSGVKRGSSSRAHNHHGHSQANRNHVEEKDRNLKSLLLHQDLLGVILSHAANKSPSIDRTDLEKHAIKHTPTSVRRCSEGRKSEVVRSCINVLLGLRVLEETDHHQSLVLNPNQARVLENVDHYSHGFFLLKELEAKLAREEQSLLAELEARSKLPPKSRSAKRLKGENAVASPVVSSELSSSSTLSPSALESDFAALSRTIHDKTKQDSAVERVRTLQRLMHSAGSRTAIERAAGNGAKFHPSALGPVGPMEMPCRAKESKGPCGSLRALGSFEEAEDAALAHLFPGAEVEIRTRPLDFHEDIALQFDVWNGQDSELGVSGRASPRPSPSPGAESIVLPAPGASPSPPLPSGTPGSASACSHHHHHPHQVVRIPQWHKLDAKEMAATKDSGGGLTEEEREEERNLGDAEVLAKHDSALEAFRVKFEKEQEAANKRRREQKEAGEKHTRDIIAKARQRSASAVSALSTHASSASAGGGGAALPVPPKSHQLK